MDTNEADSDAADAALIRIDANSADAAYDLTNSDAAAEADVDANEADSVRDAILQSNMMQTLLMQLLL